MAITLNSKTYNVAGNKALVMGDIAFDSSYAFGGESFDPDYFLGIHAVEFSLIESINGYSFAYDYSNKKIKAYQQAPAIVYDERHTADTTTGAINLNYPAAFIMNVATPGQNVKMRSTGIALASLGSNECCLASAMAAGTRTTLTTKPALDDLAGDGAFTGGSTNWTLAAGWTYGSNAVAKDGAGVGTLSHDNFVPTIGYKYKLTYTISSWTAGTSLTPSMGGVTGTAIAADGTYTEYFTATAITGLAFTPTTDVRCIIDGVTVVCMEVFTTYVTQAWKDVWDNLVQDESVTLSSSGTTDLTYTPLACMYVDRTSTTAKALTMIDEDDTAASGEVALYFGKTTAQIKATHADENAKVAKVTYIKKPSSGFLFDRAFVNEGGTKAGSDPYTNTFDYPILIWGYAGCMPINSGTTQVFIRYQDTPAAGEAVIDYFATGTRGGGAPATGTMVGSKSDVTGTAAGVWGKMSEIQTVPVEVPDGTNLAALTSVKIVMVGA